MADMPRKMMEMVSRRGDGGFGWGRLRSGLESEERAGAVFMMAMVENKV